MRRPDDCGSGTVLVLALTTVVLVAGGFAAAWGTVAVARHRAASAADLAALAAADRALRGPVPACSAAARAAEAAGARLESCRLEGATAQVVASAAVGGPLGRLGSARATARAGPSREPLRARARR